MHRLFHLLTDWSLSAPLIGLLWLSLFQLDHGIPVSPSIKALLASAIWIIYMLDRSTERDPEQKRRRHHIHTRHRRVFWLAAVLLATLNLGLLIRHPLSPSILWGGAAAGGLSLLYLAVVRHHPNPRAREWTKNLLVSLVFGLGCTFPVWIKMEPSPNVTGQVIALCALVFCNLRLIEHHETQSRTCLWELLPAIVLIAGALIVSPGLLSLTWLLSLTCMLWVYFRLRTTDGVFWYDLALIVGAIPAWALMLFRK